MLEDLSDCAEIWAALEHWNEMPYLMNPHKDALPLYVLPKVYSLNEGAQDLAEVFPEQPGNGAIQVVKPWAIPYRMKGRLQLYIRKCTGG